MKMSWKGKYPKKTQKCVHLMYLFNLKYAYGLSPITVILKYLIFPYLDPVARDIPRKMEFYI